MFASLGARCAAAALVLAALLIAAPARSAPPATMPLPAQLAPFQWLAGGAWRADLSALPGGMKLIETRYDVAPNGVIRFTTKFVKPDGGIANGYAGNLYFDAAAKRLTMWYIDARGEVTQAPVSVNGDVWSMTFTGDGAVVGRPGPASFRVDVARRANDAYTWSLFADAAGAWKPVFSLDYVRSAD
ncbi:MAG TPA: hypothetical protein VFF00_01980 [Candidatus Elarobacter sp.]|nr:hypothetical protein [Candidatus Elarobacter sp.]